MLRGVVYRLIEYLASMGHSSIWKQICAITVSNILTVSVHLSSTPSISGPGSATDIYVSCVLFTWILISYEFGSFLSIDNSINVVKMAFPIVSTYSNIKFLKTDHFNKLLSRSWRVLLSSWNYIRKVLRVHDYRDSVRKDAHTKK